MRRSALALIAVLAGSLLSCTPVQAAPNPVRLTWTARATGLPQLTQVTSARDGANRLFVVEKRGIVRVWRRGRLQRKPFLDIRSQVSTAGEGGLLSIAFRPDYARHPFFWVSYVTKAGDLRIARFRASSASAASASTSTYVHTLDVPHPAQYINHFAGQLAFGRDGYLYISTGDGGGEGDPGNRAQDLGSLSGKLLRVQVVRSITTCGRRSYCIPRSNPYATSTTRRREIWASGLRNAWRFSVDAATGDLWVGDVGQNRYEEVDRIPYGTAGGRDFGWSCREGPVAYRPSRCRSGVRYYGPTYSYSHSYGESLTGGFVYRGSRYARLLGGHYVAGDFVSGRVFVARDGVRRTAGRLASVTSFGESDGRELWAVTLDGRLLRMDARAG